MLSKFLQRFVEYTESCGQGSCSGLCYCRSEQASDWSLNTISYTALEMTSDLMKNGLTEVQI